MEATNSRTEYEEDRSTVDRSDAGRPKPSKRIALLAVIGLGIIFVVSVLYAPSGEPGGQYFTVCAFKNGTGLPCPGCGLGHSFCSIGKGHLAEAFAFNLLGPPLFLFAFLYWLRSGAVLLNKGMIATAFDKGIARLRVVRWAAVAFALFGLLRIVYIFLYQPAALQDTPIMRLIARISG